MSTRDLTYLINFDVTGSSEVTDAATDMDTLATKADDLDQAPLDFDFDFGDDLGTAADDIGDTATAVGDLGSAADTNTGKMGGLRGAFGDLGLTTLGLGSAFDIVSGAIETLSGWFDGLGVKAAITEAGSSAAADSLFGLFDAITSLEGVTFDTDSGLGALNEAFSAGIEAANEGDLEKVSEALVTLGVDFDDLSQTMLDFQANEAAAFAQVAQDAGIPLELAAALGEAATQGDSVNEMLNALSSEGIRALGEAVGLSGVQLDAFVGSMLLGEVTADSFLATLPDDARAAGEAFLEQVGAIEQLNDAAENTSDTLGFLIDKLKESPEGAAAFERISAAMPDASDAEILAALADELANIDENAPGAAEGLDAVAEPRQAFIEATTDGTEEEVRSVLEDAATDRDTTITAEADTSDAERDISAFEDTTRNVSTYLGLVNGTEFDTVLDGHTEDRTITVDIVLGDVPTASQIISRITGGTGRVVVPVDVVQRNVPRLAGTRGAFA